MRVFKSVEELAAAEGEHLGHSEWVPVTQDRVNLFADATDDHQWIHVDEALAAQGPFKGTIAHGYLTLSLVPMLTRGIYRVENLAMGVNYGTDRVRFPAPLPVGTRVRAGVEIVAVRPVAQGTQLVSRVTVEAEGVAKPVCVADVVVLLVPAP